MAITCNNIPQKRDGVRLVDVHSMSCNTIKIAIFAIVEWGEWFKGGCADKRTIT